MTTPSRTVPVVIAFGLVIFLMAPPLFFRILSKHTPNRAGGDKHVISSSGFSADERKSRSFPDVAFDAKAVLVWDINARDSLFSVREEEQFPLASLTKIAMALTALRKMSTSSEIVVDSHAVASQGDSGLLAGERWRLKDLIDFALVASSNDAARAVARAAGTSFKGRGETASPEEDFVDLMNEMAASIGLTQTYFVNETGLDHSATINGGHGSARDMALLVSYALVHAPHVLEATGHEAITLDSLNRISHEALNTNDFVKDIPWIIASKTGYTDLAGGNLIVVFDAGLAKPIVVVVLGSTLDGRFRDVQKLVVATLDYLNAQE